LHHPKSEIPNGTVKDEPPYGDQTSGWWHRIKLFIAKPLAEAELERKTYLNSKDGSKVDHRTITILVSVAILLTLQRYLLTEGSFISLAKWIQSSSPNLASTLFGGTSLQLSYLLFWALGQALLYVVVPLIQIRFFFRQPLGEYGLKIREPSKLWGVYLAMLAVMIPIVVTISTTDSFQKAYPFYRNAFHEPLWPRFWAWEGAYFLQFIGLEFFFRGYLLHGVKRQFGAYAIFVMMVPYCMIHFGKPMPETFAAIAAGVILGFMSLKTRSIWMGAALHISVALTMDLCSLWRAGKFD